MTGAKYYVQQSPMALVMNATLPLLVDALKSRVSPTGLMRMALPLMDVKQVHLETMAIAAPMETMAQKVTKVKRVTKEFKEFKESKASLEKMAAAVVHPETTAIAAQTERTVPMETMEQKVTRASREKKATRESKESKETMVRTLFLSSFFFIRRLIIIFFAFGISFTVKHFLIKNKQ